jgi:uncharacterized membrane protein YhaH (DUF805 family)
MMAYDSGAENLALLKRAVTGTFDFAGRSRRTELLYYAIATALISAVLGFVAMVTLSWTASLVANMVFRLLLALPFFALFARRLHDQNRSAWWALILPVIFAFDIARQLDFIFIGNGIEADRYPVGGSINLWIGVPMTLAYLVLAFLPGTDGPNRFGPDPRLE